MSNPAWQLHSMYSDLLERVNNQSSLDSLLQLDSQEGHKWWMAAAGLLSRIERLLDTLGREGHRVGVYQRQSRNWLSPLTGRAANGRTQAVANYQVISDEHLDQIEAVASFLDGKVREMNDPGKESLHGVVLRARTLLEEDDSLQPYLRIYIHRLIQEITNALDDHTVGMHFDFGDATTRLAVGLGAASEQSSSQTSAWKDILRDMTVNFSSGVMVEGATQTLRMLGGI